MGAEVNSIGEKAFMFCSNLKEVYISDVGSWCPIDFAGNNSNRQRYAHTTLYLNGTVLTEAVIPDGVTKIADEAFYGCSELKTVVIPDSVTYIGMYAFANCDSLESIVIPDSVTELEQGALRNCGSLREVELSDRLTWIGYDTFQNCGSLQSIVIPYCVTAIGISALSWFERM